MEHHNTWITDVINNLLGALIAPIKNQFCSAIYSLWGTEYVPGHLVIPEHVIFAIIVFLFCFLFFTIAKKSFSLENPGKIQQIFEISIEFLNSQLEEIVGHGGKRYLPMVGTIGLFILFMNLCGQIPGFASPTSSLNVTVGCALVVFFYYNYLGVKKHGILGYLKQFVGPIPLMAPLMIPIEIISHLARPFSLSVRLFANIFGEHQVAAVFFALLPFILPLPIMALGLFASFLQAFIFMVLTMVYIGGALADEH
ncbi:MAG: F0F1 ATP synthase subunit A [Acidobacteriia bacterium]|jgi:F-type H+-transporting ATPase subunit a|nr:F0F1 ATP synthase subunit A [Terriglobia bacterium]